MQNLVSPTQPRATRRFWPASVALALCLSLAPAAQADDKSHRKALIELFDLLNMEKVMHDSIDLMLQAQVQANPSLQSSAPKMRQFLNKYMSWSALKDEMVAVYQKAFTEGEVKDLLTFYKTPTGRKALQQMPKLMQEGAQIGARRVQEHLPELQEMLKEEAPAKKPAKP